MENKFAIETVYIDGNGIPHTAVYTEAEKDKAKCQFVQIRKKAPDAPIRMRGIVDGKKFDAQYGKEYDFDSLILTAAVKTEWGGEPTYLCRKHIRGNMSVTMHTKKGSKVCGISILRTEYKTDEQMMNLMNEGNFDRFYFIEDVIA